MAEQTDLEKAQWAAQTLAKHRFLNKKIWVVRVVNPEVYKYGESEESGEAEKYIQRKNEKSDIYVFDNSYLKKYEIAEAYAIAKGLESDA